MKKVCEACHKKIKGNDFIDMSKLDNPLIIGYWCRSCFLATLYSTIDGIRMNVNVISGKIDYFMGAKEEEKEVVDGEKSNCKTNL